MQHLGEVDWSLVESALENEHTNLELDSLFHRKPVKSVSYIVFWVFRVGLICGEAWQIEMVRASET